MAQLVTSVFDKYHDLMENQSGEYILLSIFSTNVFTISLPSLIANYMIVIKNKQKKLRNNKKRTNPTSNFHFECY